jgi:glutamate N-acetyltransferase/amino-acid N-acetyltransferase
VSAGDVLVCSTGLIGEQLNRDAVISGVKAAAGALGSHGDDAARAIMTTDSVPKTIVIEGPGYSIGGMAKGAGMLAPGLATMLAVLTTDAELPAAELDRALRTATRVSFERLDSDGCMSTNDQVTLMASGASGITPDTDAFTLLLIDACMALTRQLQADAEGASHDIMITVTGAVSEADAVEVARSVARSNLFKAAMFGNDPNWGRVLAAIGTTQAAFNPYAVDVSFNGVRLCHAGAPDRPRTDVDLSGRIVEVLIELTAGTELATVYTNDLTHDYVHENSAYSS